VILHSPIQLCHSIKHLVSLLVSFHLLLLHSHCHQNLISSFKDSLFYSKAINFIEAINFKATVIKVIVSNFIDAKVIKYAIVTKHN
jgi:hypothetical protein